MRIMGIIICGLLAYFTALLALNDHHERVTARFKWGKSFQIKSGVYEGFTCLIDDYKDGLLGCIMIQKVENVELFRLAGIRWVKAGDLQ